MLKPEAIFLSTIDAGAGPLARENGFGLEIAEFCTAWNMDQQFAQTDSQVREKLKNSTRRILHGPFNELFPCAIDPQARDLAARRYRQAIALAKVYGAHKVVIHGGYNPWIYYPVWYTEQSILFWQEFLREDPGVEIVLENVLEEEPRMIVRILAEVNDPRLRMCLDVGHANAYSKVSVMDWVAECAPWISHFHIHNNDGSWDTHSGLDQGTIPMETLLKQTARLCPEATYTLELTDGAESVAWLRRFLSMDGESV